MFVFVLCCFSSLLLSSFVLKIYLHLIIRLIFAFLLLLVLCCYVLFHFLSFTLSYSFLLACWFLGACKIKSCTSKPNRSITTRLFDSATQLESIIFELEINNFLASICAHWHCSGMQQQLMLLRA